MKMSRSGTSGKRGRVPACGATVSSSCPYQVTSRCLSSRLYREDVQRFKTEMWTLLPGDWFRHSHAPALPRNDQPQPRAGLAGLPLLICWLRRRRRVRLSEPFGSEGPPAEGWGPYASQEGPNLPFDLGLPLKLYRQHLLPMGSFPLLLPWAFFQRAKLLSLSFCG